MLGLCFVVLLLCKGAFTARAASAAVNGIEDLVITMFNAMEFVNFEELATSLAPAVVEASRKRAPPQKHLLCVSLSSWSLSSKDLAKKNILHSERVCDDWLLLFDTSSFHDIDPQRLTSELKALSPRIVDVVLESGVESLHEKNNQRCDDFLNEHLAPYANLSIQNNPCDLTIGIPGMHIHYPSLSKTSMMMNVLKYLPFYEYVWVMEDDYLSLTDADVHALAVNHQCSFEVPPLVAQPSHKHEMCDSRGRSRQLRNLADSDFVAFSVQLVDTTMPLFNSVFLQWFIVGIVAPLQPVLHIAGSTENLHDIFCGAARQFLKATASPDQIACACIYLPPANAASTMESIAIGAPPSINVSDMALKKVVRYFFGRFFRKKNVTHLPRVVRTLQEGCTMIDKTLPQAE